MKKKNKSINQIFFSFTCVECCAHSIFRNNNFYNLIFLLFFYRSRFDQLWVKLNGGSASVRLKLLCSPFWFIRKGQKKKKKNISSSSSKLFFCFYLFVFFEHFRQVFSFVWFLVPFVCVCVCVLCVCVHAVCVPCVGPDFWKKEKYWRDKKERKKKKD